MRLVVANIESSTTFRRAGCQESNTLVTERLSLKLLHFKALQKYSGSDHQYIKFRKYSKANIEHNFI